MNLFCVGADFKTHGVAEREKLSLSRETQDLLLRFFARHRSFAEFAVLSTCNRTEFYFVTTMAEEKALRELVASLGELHKLPEDWLDTAYYYRDEEAVRHLFELTGGLRSMVVGETEIFGQVKKAYEAARASKTCGRLFNRLFQSAFAAAKQARARSDIGRGNVSVASLARDAALARLPVAGRLSLLVLGTGEAGRATARAFAAAGVRRVACGNRNAATGAAFAREIGAEFLPTAAWRERLAKFDLIVTCVGAAEFILRREDFAGDKARVVIDLGVPRNVEPAVAGAAGVTLLNIDNLQTAALRNLRQRARQADRCLELLAPLVKRFAEHHRRQAPRNPADNAPPKPGGRRRT